MMRDAIAARKGIDVEVVNYLESGKPYWIAKEVRAIIDQGGHVARFITIQSDITVRKNVQAERNEMQEELLAISRQVVMAEVATDILHNVGNVLNSVNVSASIAVERLKASPIEALATASKVISEQFDLVDLSRSDPPGKSFPKLLREVGDEPSRMLGRKGDISVGLAEHAFPNVEESYLSSTCSMR